MSRVRIEAQVWDATDSHVPILVQGAAVQIVKPGTTTQVPVYDSQIGGSALTQPLSTDVTGTVPQAMYVESGQDYERLASWTHTPPGGGPTTLTAREPGVAVAAQVDSGLISVKGYGGIADGTSHPLSEKFTTLAAAQVMYPLAVALTEEIDRVAYDAAVAAAVARGNAPILLGPGSWMADKTYKLRSNCPVLGFGEGVTTIKRKRGAAIVIVANKECIDLTGTNDTNCKIDGVTIDGNSPETTFNGEQAIGIEYYAVDGFTASHVEVINCPYGGIDGGARAACADGAGQGESPAGSPPAKSPRPMSRITKTHCYCHGNGWQEKYIEVSARLLSSTTVGQQTVTLETGGGVNLFGAAAGRDGQWVGIEVQGEPNFETIQIDTVVGDVVHFKTALTKAHGAHALIGGSLYWADSGFGLIARQPARTVDIFKCICDRNYEAGIAIGQTSNIKYDPLNVRGVRVTDFESTRSSSTSVVFRLGFCDDASVSSGFIGDIGSTLLSGSLVSATTVTLQAYEGALFYGGEVVYVGNPGAAALEQATIDHVTGDVVTFTAPLANAHAANEQIFAAMSDLLYLRQAGSTNQQGYKINGVELRHGNNGCSASISQDTFLNRRHTLTGVKSWQNRGDGLRLLDVSSVKAVASFFHDNGGWGVRQQQTLTAGLTHDDAFIGVECTGNTLGQASLIGGTYRAVACVGIADA